MVLATNPFDALSSAPGREPSGAPWVRVERLVTGGLGPVSFDLDRGGLTLVASRPVADAAALLRAATGLGPALGGRVTIAGRELTALEPVEARRARYELVGYVLRDIGLDASRTVAENMAAPLAFVGRPTMPHDARWLAQLAQLAQSFALGGDLDRPAGELDCERQQRVAIARALATRPALVYAEEPVATLGEREGRVVLALLRTIAHEYGIAIAVASADPEVAAMSDRLIALRDGEIVGDERGAGPARLAELLGRAGAASRAAGPVAHPAG